MKDSHVIARSGIAQRSGAMKRRSNPDSSVCFNTITGLLRCILYYFLFASFRVGIQKTPRNDGRAVVNFRKFLIIASAMIMLTSCTQAPPPPISTPLVVVKPKEKDAWLSSLQTWQAEGSFGARKADDAWSGSFEWKQFSKNTYQIHFYGPFGAGNTYLLGDSHQVVWKDNDGETIASTPDELIWRKTGFLFPVSYLYDWILGRPAPGSATHKQWDAQGHLIYFNQAGWNVTYLAYQPIGSGELPSIIRLTHENIQLKLVIHQWRVG